MPRGPRDDAPGAAHHVMLRGIERRAIFLDDADREAFLERLSRLVPELGFICFAWVLMPNHVHLVLRSGLARLSLLMARLGTGYARYFNERHDRVGHLFQNRFRSRRVHDDADLIGLVRYVTRNPLEGGLVPDPSALEHFPWCGLGALLGRVRPLPFEAVRETLALFGEEPMVARRELRACLEMPAVLEARQTPAPVVPGSAAPAPNFDALLHRIAAAHALAPEILRSPRRTRDVAVARAELARRAGFELGLSGAEIARRLGLSTAAVSKMRRRPPETS
jgi:REP element-mobilizing transposase RayT